MNRALISEQAGRPLGAVEPARNGGQGAGQRPDSAAFPNLPSEPLAKKIEELIVRERAGLFAYAPPFKNAKGKPMADNVRSVVCRRLGITDKAVREWREGKVPTVRFDVADGILGRSPWLWFDVWDANDPVVYDAFESTELIAA